ncbi:MAG: glycosyltransferase family 2 protein [Sulfitobacter sp.]
MKISVLIPAHNEAAYLSACLDALLNSTASAVEIIVIANGCTDATAEIAAGYEVEARNKGWAWIVLDIAQGGKLNALNQGELKASGEVLIYLDADVQVSPDLIAQIGTALDGSRPAYASGKPHVTVTGEDAITRHFTRFWLTTPFMMQGVPGFGVFAMNKSGRERWGPWPDIISDDTFARLNFSADERVRVPASYQWPMVEGFTRLVQVRRRQDAGVAEIAAQFPKLLENDDPRDAVDPIWKRALKDPVAFVVFCAVRVVVRLPVLRNKDRWARGR